jgi:UDP-MurNAc hydroxylase
LEDWERADLGRGVFLSTKTVDDDSLCFIETPERTYLNVNDCVAGNARALHESIASKVGSPDVLFAQFSLANWAGNPGQTSVMQALAREKLDQIALQLEIYRPKTLIPFASFVWFCRPENFHLNAGANRIGDVYKRFSPIVDCVVLYPGDVYEVGSSHDSSAALASYAVDEARHIAPTTIEDETFSTESLMALSLAHIETMRSKNGMWIFWPLLWLGYIKPVSIHLTDIGQSLRYSMFDGIRWEPIEREKTSIEFTSAAMAQMLRHGSGYDTLYISGRFTEHRTGSRFDLSKNFFVLRRNEHGQFFPGSFLTFAFIQSRIRQRLASNSN